MIFYCIFIFWQYSHYYTVYLQGLLYSLYPRENLFFWVGIFKKKIQIVVVLASIQSELDIQIEKRSNFDRIRISNIKVIYNNKNEVQVKS